jgi:uncharacterized membrane protein (DUF485 family)
MKDRDIRRLRRHIVLVRSAILLIFIFGLISFVLFFDPSLLNTPVEPYKGKIAWLLLGTLFVAMAIFSFFLIGRWSRRLLWIVRHTVPRPMHLVFKVEEDSENTQYYAHLTPADNDPRNQRIWRIALWGPSHEKMKAMIGRDLKAQVYFDPKSGRPAAIESEFGLTWAMAGSGAAEQKE